MRSSAYASGFVIGLLIAVVLCVVLIRYMNRDKKLKTQYDEMQQKARGRAFMVAFYAVLILEAVFILVDMVGLRLPMTAEVTRFTVIVVGVTVLAVHCIWHDAYVGLNTNVKRYSVILIIAGAINLLAAVMAVINDSMFADGQLQAPFINLLCAVMLIVIGGVMIAKKRIDNREEDKEDSAGGEEGAGSEEGDRA